MKKSTLLAFACALAVAPAAVAQENAQEVTYVEDATQGYLLNSFKDNWFITGEGGVDILFNKYNDKRDLTDRFEPAAGLYIGKWFSPSWGGRVGVNWLKTKSLSDIPQYGNRPDEPLVDGQYYKQVYSHVGPVFDVMCNFTNLICGYHPGRVYNFIGYVGAGGYWTFAKKYEGTESKGWKNAHEAVLNWRAGIINSFNVSKQVQLSLDLRFTAYDNHANQAARPNNTAFAAQAYLGLTYLFNDREWHHPVVPVCPEPENCDAYRQLIAQANARIADLEQQLKDCLNRPMPTQQKKDAIATIYYPINVSKINRTDAAILDAVAQVMKDNPNTEYKLTGWADNYTGNATINTRLRNNRVNGVEKYLKKQGVPAAQMQTTISDQNRLDLGIKYAPLDRCVTIEEIAK